MSEIEEKFFTSNHHFDCVLVIVKVWLCLAGLLQHLELLCFPS